MRSVVFRGREDKLSLVADVFAPYLRGDVLDVGCDVKHLSRYVGGRYVGIDKGGTPDLIVDTEHVLPFKGKSFDVVVAFDILEHLDNMHGAFDQLCRVCKRYVIIGLPNMYEWRFRVAYVLGRRLSGKYGLPVDPPPDRHRWLFSLSEARQFVHQRGRLHGFELIDEVIGYYRYRRALGRTLTALGLAFHKLGWGCNLFAYHYWATLERRVILQGC